jgi:RNA polymerase sigma factor (sigma-70 family)
MSTPTPSTPAAPDSALDVALQQIREEAPLARPRPRPRRRRRRSYYAIKATEGEIILPAFKEPGYLRSAKLIRAAQAGSQEAKQQFWLANSRLGYSGVNWARVRPDRAADAVQEAQIGICRAIEKFDVQRLLAFSTYATYWVRQRIRRQRQREDLFVPVPNHLYAAYLHFRKRVVEAEHPAAWFEARENLLTADAVAYERLLRLHVLAAPVPLTRTCHPASAPDDACALLERQEQDEALRRALKRLAPRDREILSARYGLDGQGERTLETVGRQLGLTRERVRQLQNNALARLRTALAAEGVHRPRAASAAPATMASPSDEHRPDQP